MEALRGEGLNVTEVDVSDREPVLPEGTRMAVNMIHGTFGEDGELQEYLERLGVPYTGAGVESSPCFLISWLKSERGVN